MIITIELMIICFFVDRIEENFVSFAIGILTINASPTVFDIHLTECPAPEKINFVIF